MSPLVVAHRGASGYLPENTLSAAALAHGQGADAVECDVVLTKDGHVLVNHDLWLDEVSDVARRFPGRARDDGHFYALDFTLDEILTLEVTDRYRVEDGREVPVFPDRFPLWQSDFRFHTLRSQLELIRGLERSTGRSMGVFVELKTPWWHEREGVDLVRPTLDALASAGYRTRDDQCWVLSFDPHALERIRRETGPAAGVDLPLTQLIAEVGSDETYEQVPDGSWRRYDYAWMHELGEMPRIRAYADAIGPDYHDLVRVDGHVVATNGMAAAAHDAGLMVAPWAVRADQLPPWASSMNDVLDVLIDQVGVDSVTTDFPDIARAYVDASSPGQH